MIIDTENRAPQKILAQLKKSRPSLLEIGCGDGRLTSPLVKQLIGLTALDVDLRALLAMKKQEPVLSCCAASGQHLPFADCAFDYVLFSQSLHHQEASIALMEAKRVLRNDGCVLILEPVFGSELENICLLFEDERAARLQAFYGIMTSGLAVRHAEIFGTTWRFEDRSDLKDWLFNYYQKPWDPALAERIEGLLPIGAGRNVLDIGERLLLVCLHKAGRH